MRWIITAAGLVLLSLAGYQEVALKDLMPKGMAIGVAINQRQFEGTDAAAVDIITKQFNQISPENVLKFQPTQPAADRYAFEAADRYVQFGVDRHMQVVGHNLVWHSQTGAWVFQGADGKPADRDTLLARMRDHIRTVVGRYKGKIHGWDVVNEAIDEDGSLRKSPWQVGIGDDYIAKAFEFAHEADPDAELYYNDFNLEKPAKRAGVIKLVRDLQARKLRIDGIGNQAHWRLETPTVDEIDKTLVELHSTGLKVMYTELDINLLPNTPRGADPAVANPYANGLPDEIQQQLARRYADVFRLFVKHRDAVTRVTFWGLSDADSWLNRGRMNYPLLWDRQRRPKPAFDAVVDALRRRRSACPRAHGWQDSRMRPMESDTSALASWSPEQIALGRRWVEAWKNAGPELERIRRRELRQLDAYAAIALLCGPADYGAAPRAPKPTSGLIEQQRVFRKLGR